MSDDKVSVSLANVIKDYTWLVPDFFVFLVLATVILGYKDFDPPLKMLVRGLMAFSLWFFSISGLHIVMLMRSPDNKISPWKTYTLFLLKFILLGLFLCWGYFQGAFFQCP
jgi:hypothetical protein